MNIYSKIDNLKKSLDKEQVIIDIKEVQNQILNDEELLNKIKKHENINDEYLIRKYKHLENGVNYIIMSINKELKTIVVQDKIKDLK